VLADSPISAIIPVVSTVLSSAPSGSSVPPIVIAPIDDDGTIFEAVDAAGNGTFHAEMKYLLPHSTNENRTLIVVRYQSDGKEPGPKLGDYGKIAHVQLLYRLPLPETMAVPVNQSTAKQPGFEGIFALIGLLAAALIAFKKR